MINILLIDSGVFLHPKISCVNICGTGFRGQYSVEDILDTVGHGTAVAFLLIKGIDISNIRLSVVKLFDDVYDCSIEDLLECLEYVSEHNEYDLINMSFGVVSGYECEQIERLKFLCNKIKNAKRALHDVNVTIRNGEVIAVVGENGAGKTTFINLLSGLFVGKEGEILLNGTEISQYTKADLTKFFGVIHQDFHLFPMSVRDNIRAGEELSEEEIQNAVNQLEVRKKIRNLDQSISREFADDGLVLSGGESQQLMLARIIANRYPFVILDEPTSALDPLTERKINRYVMQTLASPERTILFISHRLFTTQLADRILVFDKGTIVEEGNHCELMEKKGHYYEMYQLQQKLYGQEEIESAKTENDRPE